MFTNKLGVIVSKSTTVIFTTEVCVITNAYRATQLNHSLTTLLRDLSHRVDNEVRQMIEDALDDVSTYRTLEYDILTC